MSGALGGFAGEDMSSSSDSETSESLTSTEEYSWIRWFCDNKGNEFFCEVDESYIQDKFNLTGIPEMVPHYKEALAVILDMEQDEDMDEPRGQAIEHSAEMLYGLIHARFILTNRGLQKMMAKFHAGDFGRCTRVLCENQRVLPVGLSDLPSESTVNVYCPRCNEVYAPKSSRHKQIDGAYFGTTFPHMLFTVYPDQRPTQPFVPFVPRCFGFKIHPSAYEEQKHRMELEQAHDQQQRH